MENEEKRYTITKIDRIDNNISEAKKRIVAGSIFVGVESLTIAAFIINAVNVNSGLELISGITLGALSIYSFTDLKKEYKDLKSLKELRTKLREEQLKEEKKVR